MKSVAFFVPGLKRRSKYIEKITRNWGDSFPINPIILRLDWSHGTHQEKINFLKKIIESTNANEIHLIGISAGASLVFATYLQLSPELKNKITNIVNICGRLRSAGWPPLGLSAWRKPAFRDMVTHVEQNLVKLDINDRRKILTISGLWDGVVPLESMRLKSVRHIRYLLITHFLSIRFALWRLRHELAQT